MYLNMVDFCNNFKCAYTEEEGLDVSVTITV